MATLKELLPSCGNLQIDLDDSAISREMSNREAVLTSEVLLAVTDQNMVEFVDEWISINVDYGVAAVALSAISVILLRLCRPDTEVLRKLASRLVELLGSPAAIIRFRVVTCLLFLKTMNMLENQWMIIREIKRTRERESSEKVKALINNMDNLIPR
jgi:hypothetical protein